MKTLPAILIVAAMAACASTVPEDRGIRHKTYALKHAAADQVAKTLTGEEQGTADHRVVIVSDSQRNAVVVRGTPEDLARIEKRIRELDR